jgi:hypothetical protein
MVGYTLIESSVVARFISHYSSELSETRCMAADIDLILQSMFDENSEYGCLFEFGGGSDEPRKPFKIDVWTWYVDGLFMIRLTSGIDQKKRAIIDKMTKVFSSDHTLGGISPRVRMVNIGKAELGDVGDIPFFFIPFQVEALDRDAPER